MIGKILGTSVNCIIPRKDISELKYWILKYVNYIDYSIQKYTDFYQFFFHSGLQYQAGGIVSLHSEGSGNCG